MVTEEMLSDEVLRKATAEQAIAINDNMSSTNECQHELSIEFEKRIQSPTTWIWSVMYSLFKIQ